MKKSNKFASIFGVIIFIIFLVIYIGSTVIDLISLSDPETVNTDTFNIGKDGISITGDFKNSEGPVFTVNHSINYLIPAGSEYFFIMYDTNYENALYVRADEDFDIELKKEISKKAAAGDNSGITLTGKLREMDSKLRRETRDITNTLQNEYGIKVAGNGSSPIYLDLIAKRLCILKLVTILSIIAAAALLIILSRSRKKTESNPILQRVLGILFALFAVGGILLLIYTVIFMF